MDAHLAEDQAFIYYDNKVTGTNNDPYIGEIVMVRNKTGEEDVTKYLSYDAILHFMSKGCESRQPLLKKDVMKARDIMVNIWKKATGGESDDDKIVWIEPGASFWMFSEKRSYVLGDFMSLGPKELRVCCGDPNLDEAVPYMKFWDIIFNDHSYEVYAQYWLQ
jgi:hypothetical protein